MNLLNKLTIKNLLLNKKRTIVTIVGIMLSVALITAVASLYASGIKSLTAFEIYEKGNYHVAFYNVPKTDLSTFENNRYIDNLYITKDIGYAKLENSQNKYKPYAYIQAFTKESLNNLAIKLVKGRIPINDEEIIIPTHLKTNGRITLKIGDEITLNIGDRINDNTKLTDNPFMEGEQLIPTFTKTYKIVGIIERPDSGIESYSNPGYTFITSTTKEELTDNINIYAHYNKAGLKDNYNVTANILNVNPKLFKKLYQNKILTPDEMHQIDDELTHAKYIYSDNNYLISLESNPLGDSSIGSLSIIIFIVAIIIMVTSIFCIKNSFDISITEKTKQYGMLRSIGATKKQIKKNVFYEATVLGLIGIPLGLLLGYLASFILIIISNYYLNKMLASHLNLMFSFSFKAMIISIILGIITIYLSAIRSASKASKTSPITAIKNNNNIKLTSKKLKSPKLIKKVYGIGGLISYKNLKRNKKKYRTTVISIILSVAVFIVLNYFVSLSYSTITTMYKSDEYNLHYSMNLNENKEEQKAKIKETILLDNIEEFSVIRSSNIIINKASYSNYYKTNNLNSNGYLNINVLGKDTYLKYINELGLNYENVKDKGILIDKNKTCRYDTKKNKDICENVHEFNYQKGNILNALTNDQKNLIIEIAKVTDLKPFGLKNNEQSMLIISDELYDNYFIDNNVSVYFKSNNPNKLQDNIDQILKGFEYNLNNQDEQVKMMENFYTLVSIFLYGFIIVISLIGITNIFNTITTNMELRQSEFAMLKSIGMTEKEFKRMIKLESLFMGVKSLIYGIIIGLLLTFLLYISIKDDGLTYNLPIIAIIISIVTVFILISLIMRYSLNKINKQNIIETIRNENI